MTRWIAALIAWWFVCYVLNRSEPQRRKEPARGVQLALALVVVTLMSISAKTHADEGRAVVIRQATAAATNALTSGGIRFSSAARSGWKSVATKKG
jgi:hypothetical protein